ncbi:hypothetical protein AURDEDRAFT_163750 [Auricularia subglabra TFB-10046 SS5]|nr:hypothetical protein AURDEDRAFT_163750 [Auricularia subglabra TFB-10046 SS5]
MVSRDFYVATRHAGLYIPCTLSFDDEQFDRIATEVARLTEIVLHTSTYDRLLSLDIRCSDSDEALTGPDIPTPVLDAFTTLARALSLSLERLVNLAVYVPLPLVPLILESLRLPAPLLRSFVFECDQGNPEQPASHSISVSLFGNEPHNLRHVSLSSIVLPAVPIPAFSRVSRVQLSFGGARNLDIGLHFPRTVDMELRCDPSDDNKTPPELSFTGLTLEGLVVRAGADYAPDLLLSAVNRRLHLDSIPVIQMYTYGCDSATLLWQSIPERLVLWIEADFVGDADMCVVVSSPGTGWTRLLHFHIWCPELYPRSPIEDLPFLDNIVQLRLDNRFLDGILRDMLSLEVLEHIQIDLPSRGPAPGMLWPPAWKDGVSHGDALPESWCFEVEYPEYWLTCPSLKVLTLSAVDRPMTVNSREVAYLGCALGQENATWTETAGLVLVGVSFATPASRDLIEETFCVVLECKFTGAGAPEDLGLGMSLYEWDTLAAALILTALALIGVDFATPVAPSCSIFSCENYDEGLWEEGL